VSNTKVTVKDNSNNVSGMISGTDIGDAIKNRHQGPVIATRAIMKIVIGYQISETIIRGSSLKISNLSASVP
jgi:hypothetical protein